MNPAEADPEEAKNRSLRRWMWGLVAASFLLMVLGGGMLKLAPDLFSDTLSKLFMAAVGAGVVAYFFVRGEPAYRKARASWFGAWVLLLGVAPAMFITNNADQRREGEKVAAIVDALATSVKNADRATGERLAGAITARSRGVIGSPGLVDVALRRDAGDELAAARKVIDEGLASRARLREQAISTIEATHASSKLKQTVVAELRATAQKEPLAVQLLKAMRAFVMKAEEVVAFVEANTAAIEAREGRIEIADAALRERYGKLEAELAAAQDALRSLK